METISQAQIEYIQKLCKWKNVQEPLHIGNMTKQEAIAEIDRLKALPSVKSEGVTQVQHQSKNSAPPKPTQNFNNNRDEQILFGQCVNLVHAEWLSAQRIVTETNQKEFAARITVLYGAVKMTKKEVLGGN